jgi:hypothetical protein
MSSREAYPRRDTHEVNFLHARRPELLQSLARAGRVGDEGGDVYLMACRREGSEPIDSFIEQHRRAVVVAAAPMMERDADLQDAVIERSVRRARGAPEQLERLVLFEELAAVELFGGFAKRSRCELVAACADRLGNFATGDAFGRTRRLALAATRRAAFR